jgi:hypothetical protein
MFGAQALFSSIKDGGFFDSFAPLVESTIVLHVVGLVLGEMTSHFSNHRPLGTLLFGNFYLEDDNSHIVRYNETQHYTNNTAHVSPVHFSIKTAGRDFVRCQGSDHQKQHLESLASESFSGHLVLNVEAISGSRFSAPMDVRHLLGNEINASPFVNAQGLRCTIGVVKLHRDKKDVLRCHIPVVVSTNHIVPLRNIAPLRTHVNNDVEMGEAPARPLKPPISDEQAAKRRW